MAHIGTSDLEGTHTSNILTADLEDRILIFAQSQFLDSMGEISVPENAEHMSGVGFGGRRWTAQAPITIDLPDGVFGAVVPAALARGVAEYSPVIVFDVDSTLIEQEVIELLAAHAGREAEVAAVTDAAMRGELDFAESLHHRVKALAGLDASVIDAVVDTVRFQPGATELVAAVNAAGGAAYAVSGGFEQVLAPLAEQISLADYRANTLEIVDGRLTGRVLGSVVDRAEKARMLRQWAQTRGVPTEFVIAVGDGANDIDMLDAAGFGVAYCAKPALRSHADLALDVRSLDVVRALFGL